MHGHNNFIVPIYNPGSWAVMWQNLPTTQNFQSSQMKGDCQKSRVLCYHHFLCMGQELSATCYYPEKILASLFFALWRVSSGPHDNKMIITTIKVLGNSRKEANRKSQVIIMPFSKTISHPSHSSSPLFSWEKFKQHRGLHCGRERR